MNQGEYPKYQVTISGAEYMLPLYEVSHNLNVHTSISLGNKALEADGVVRPITDEERNLIHDVAAFSDIAA